MYNCTFYDLCINPVFHTVPNLFEKIRISLRNGFLQNNSKANYTKEDNFSALKIQSCDMEHIILCVLNNEIHVVQCSFSFH